MRSVAEAKGDFGARGESSPTASSYGEELSGILERASEWNLAGDRVLWFGGVRDGD
jgi:hypothetical protein